jgi:hypothetical protein
LKSPPQAEKLLMPTRKNKVDPKVWAQLEALVDRPAGKPVLTSIDDPRTAISTAEDKMDEVEDEDDQIG